MSSPSQIPVAKTDRNSVDWRGAKSAAAKSPSDSGTRLYLPRPNPMDCKCDVHDSKNQVWKNRYKQLSDKERRLHDELLKVSREMTSLVSLMIDSAPATQSVYKTDYEKKDLPITQYRPLMAAVDSTIESPITPAVIDLKDIYKDPFRFKYSAMEETTIQPAKTIALLKVPENVSFWDKPFTGQSEYIDNISEIGLSNMKNQQQYLEPLASSRKMSGDCNS